MATNDNANSLRERAITAKQQQRGAGRALADLDRLAAKLRAALIQKAVTVLEVEPDEVNILTLWDTASAEIEVGGLRFHVDLSEAPLYIDGTHIHNLADLGDVIQVREES